MKKVDFVISGCIETGDYTIQEANIGLYTTVHEVKRNRRSGLKENRKWIGEYVISKYDYPLNKVVTHKCVKPGRDEKKYPIHKWELNQYI
ncbi:hypothetical protein WQ54_19380 [Bacillus sp. SA1-12]|uniref:hypothetical protein n=1 Tax=Bacillus sp. SA1-12 TaxID=1455638 RepID=UPI000626F3C6|nr:hypothetical protein [Bacillus sp. SA1-12]KKI90684.1 hypothetical protein WQ54_19380 [Bacillus sp. SA1-12]